MPHMLVAVHALHCLLQRGMLGRDIVYQVLMTAHAIILQDTGVLLVYPDWFMEILKGKTLGVPEAILCLGYPLAHELMG